MSEITNTIIIPHLNQQEHLLKCLDTLWKYTPENFRVILIDQSNDSSLFEKVKGKVHLHVKVYRNLGFAKAVNTGIRLADTTYVTLVNDDVEFIHKKWWDGVMRTFQMYDSQKPQVLCVNPGSMRKLNAEGWPVDDKDFPHKDSWTEEEYDAMIQKESGGRENGIIVDGITPWCATFHREGLLRVGLFDESYYPGGGEDYDLQNRAYLKGKAGLVERHRCLGSSLSMAWHWWCKTKVTQNAFKVYEEASHLYQRKWGTPEHPNPYPNGSQGKKLEELEYPEYVIKEL